MNYKEYYVHQVGSGLPVFTGSSYQKGYGLGGTFRRFFKWVIPLLSKHTIPIAKNVGKELVKGVSNVALDTLEGKNFEDSAKQNIETAFTNLKANSQAGSGKRKAKKRRIRDLFKPLLKKKTKTVDIFSQKPLKAKNGIN